MICKFNYWYIHFCATWYEQIYWYQLCNILYNLQILEDDDDSGADSLNDQSLQSSLCGDSSGGDWWDRMGWFVSILVAGLPLVGAW